MEQLNGGLMFQRDVEATSCEHRSLVSRKREARSVQMSYYSNKLLNSF